MKLHLVASACAVVLCSAVAASAAPAVAAPKEEVYVVKIISFDKSCEYKLCTPTEFDNLQNRARLEEQYLARALAEAQKEWSTNDATKGTRFPAGTVAPRRVTTVAKYTDRNKAMDRHTALSDKVAEEKKNEDDKLREKQKNMSTAQKAKDLRKESDYQSALKMITDKLDAMVLQDPKKDPKGAAGPKDKAGAPQAREPIKIL